MGRARRPVESRLLDGSYEPGRHGPLPDTTEPTAPPTRPTWLEPNQRKAWELFSGLLKNVLRERDGPMLAQMCVFHTRLADIRKEFKRIRPGEKGYNQLLIAEGICFDKFDKIASRFGLTPSDRAKLRAEMVGPVKPKVATRPKTKLDRAGGPR